MKCHCPLGDGKAVIKEGKSEDLPGICCQSSVDLGFVDVSRENQGPRIDLVGPGFFISGPETGFYRR